MWLDKSKTSPYKFYQYWFNSSDEDAESYIKIFTLLDQEKDLKFDFRTQVRATYKNITKTIAEEVTRMVHSDKDLEKAKKPVKSFFGKSTAEDLKKLDEQTFLEVFEEYLNQKFLELISMMEPI